MKWSIWHSFFEKKISKKLGTIFRNIYLHFYDCRSISVARSEVRNIHTHIPVNKGITIQTVSVYGGDWHTNSFAGECYRKYASTKIALRFGFFLLFSIRVTDSKQWYCGTFANSMKGQSLVFVIILIKIFCKWCQSLVAKLLQERSQKLHFSENFKLSHDTIVFGLRCLYNFFYWLKQIRNHICLQK